MLSIFFFVITACSFFFSSCIIIVIPDTTVLYGIISNDVFIENDLSVMYSCGMCIFLLYICWFVLFHWTGVCVRPILWYQDTKFLCLCFYTCLFYYVILTYITVPSCFYVVQFDPILCDGFIFFVQPRHWHIWPTVFCFWYVERRTYIKRDLFHLIVFISFLYNLLRVLMSIVKLVSIDINVSTDFPLEIEHTNTQFSILYVLSVI